MDSPAQHTPVLPDVVLEFVASGPSRIVVDCTVGLGGHTSLILERCPDAQVIALDADPGNLDLARQRCKPFGDRIRFVHANFSSLPTVLERLGESTVDVVFADLGLCSNQLADPSRGFSFEVDGPLDMRMDRRSGPTAEDLVNSLSAPQLEELLCVQSQERYSRRISRRICAARREGRLRSTVQLARLVESALGAGVTPRRDRIHPATRTFLALRAAVNRETESLGMLLDAVPSVLAPGGRVVLISFHSTEDRVVKRDFRTRGRSGVYRVLTKKPLVAGRDERLGNPRCRSAKLRAAVRTELPL